MNDLKPKKDPITNLYGFIETWDNNAWGIEPIYEMAYPFNDYFAVVYESGKRKIIDGDGSDLSITELENPESGLEDSGLYIYKEKGLFGIISIEEENGKEIAVKTTLAEYDNITINDVNIPLFNCYKDGIYYKFNENGLRIN